MNNPVRFVFIFLSLSIAVLYSDVPRIINYQGKLVDDSGAPEEDPVDLTFNIWDAASGGNKLWEQISAGVDPIHGIFTVELDFTAGWETGYDLDDLDGGDVYIQITVEADVLSPRERLTSSFFAITVVDTAITDGKIRWANEGMVPVPGQVSAADIPIEDAGGHFTTDNVETALQEIGSGGGGGGGEDLTQTLEIDSVAGGHIIDMENRPILNVATPTTGDSAIGQAASTEFLLGEAYATSMNWKMYSYRGAGGSAATGSGDDWGSQVVQTAIRLFGNGTSGNELDIAQQGATSGQVLKWDGSNWTPADDATGSGGDDWGSQVIVSNSPISGDGTSSSHLLISQANGSTDGYLTSADWTAFNDDDYLSGEAAGGDLYGTYPDPTVSGIQTRDVASTVPSDGQALVWDDGESHWEPRTVSAGGDDWGSQVIVSNSPLSGDGTSSSHLLISQANGSTDGYLSSADWNTFNDDDYLSGEAAGGDLSGTYPDPTVDGLQTRAVASTAPSDGQVLTWNNGATQWEPQSPSGGTDSDWQVSGSDMYSIPSGNVGIGTTSPSNRLVLRRQNATTVLRITTDDGSGAGGVGDVYTKYSLANGGMAPGAYIWTTGIDNSDGQKYKISGAADNAYPGFNDHLTVTGSGRVGIETTAPNEVLTVEGRFSLNETTAPSATVDYGKIYVKSSDSKLYFLDDGGSEFDLTAGADNLGNHIATENLQVSGYWLSNDGGDEGVWVATDGDVGIGTSSPVNRLDVYDDSPAVNRAARIRNTVDAASEHGLLVSTARNASDAYVFQAASNGGATSRLYVRADGNVGVGTTTPSENLDVNGGVKIASTTSSNDGTIRWNGTHFQGYKSGWVNLDEAGWHGSSTRIKILPSDFVVNDDKDSRIMAYYDDPSPSNNGIRSTDDTSELYAFVAIPTGYTATHARVYGNSDDLVYVYESNFDDGVWGASLGSAALGTEIDITDVASDDTNFLVIKIDSDSKNDIIYGGYVTIVVTP